MRKLLWSLSLIVASSLHAARFDVVRNGEPVADAEVCVFAASDTTTLLTRFLADRGGVRCTPPGESIETGPGRWNVFAKKGSTLVSERVELVDAGSPNMKLEVVDAATIGPGSWNYVWVPRTRSAIPLHANALVPAGRVIPLVVTKDGITHVGPAMTLTAGELRQLDEPVRRDQMSDAAVPVVFRSVPEDSSEPPVVEVVDDGGRTYRPEARLERSDVAAGQALLFYRDIRFGQMTSRVRGERWKSADVPFDRLGEVAVPRQPVEVRASTKVSVHWWTSEDLRELSGARRICRPRSEGERIPEFRAKLLFCGDDARKLNAYVAPQSCKEVAQQKLSTFVMSGDAVFEDVAPGTYFIQVQYPRLPSLQKKVEVSARRSNDLDFELRWFTFYGKVTMHGEPVEAELFDTSSDPATGRYHAALPSDPRTTPQTITTCDGKISYTIVPDAGPVANSSFDVDIAQNRIEVEVVEALSGKPLVNAEVSLGATFDDDPTVSHFGGFAGKTDEAGVLVIEPVLTNKNIEICAKTDDHEATCADSFQMGETRKRIVHIALKRTGKRAGQIVSRFPIVDGQVVWVTRDGRISEIVRNLDAEGRFIWTREHALDEMLSFSAPGHPLFVTNHPLANEGEALVIRIPDVPRRTFEVSLAATERDGAFVALRIGSAVASINTLGWHLQRRKLQGALQPGHSVFIPDILATGPIRVILVPFPVMARYPQIEMPFIPEIGSLPQQDLGDRDAITFGAQTPRAITALPASTSSR